VPADHPTIDHRERLWNRARKIGPRGGVVPATSTASNHRLSATNQLRSASAFRYHNREWRALRHNRQCQQSVPPIPKYRVACDSLYVAFRNADQPFSLASIFSIVAIVPAWSPLVRSSVAAKACRARIIPFQFSKGHTDRCAKPCADDRRAHLTSSGC
jgi:hypothetical protein